MRVLVIDNYDSFAYNLVQYLGELGAEVEVVRNDKASVEELEPSRRAIYGGAVGYVSYTGNMDLSIAIRTLVTTGDVINIQAGAGIVADSVPAEEYAESQNKARAVLAAVEIARRAPAGGGGAR